ncbi:MAG: efflux RND transporter permease subunit, partial [Verrucomicrobia bacterium]|nr:efflux RND transporter permease subunit [Verrucomicrobiota bacterium]
MIKWFANNGIAANLLMIGILLAGIHAAYFRVPLEVSPAFELNVVRMTISYPGATPKDIEKAILLPVEQALEGIKGVKMVNADAYRGNASFWIDADPGRNLQELMDDIDSRVRGITTFPANMEPPRLYIPDSADWLEVIKVAVTGNLSEMDLRRVALDVQDDLLELPGVSRVEIQGRKQMEISVELDQRKMEAYAVTF